GTDTFTYDQPGPDATGGTAFTTAGTVSNFQIVCADATPLTSGSNYVVTLTGTAPASVNGNAPPPTQGFVNTAVSYNNPTNALLTAGGTAVTPVSTTYTTNVQRQSDLSVSGFTATATVPLSGAATTTYA